jgi:hypothetical protein
MYSVLINNKRRENILHHCISLCLSVEHHFEPGRRSGPEAGQSAPVGRTVRACAEQFRVPSFVLCLLARFAELARNPVV